MVLYKNLLLSSPWEWCSPKKPIKNQLKRKPAHTAPYVPPAVSWQVPKTDIELEFLPMTRGSRKTARKALRGKKEWAESGRTILQQPIQEALGSSESFGAQSKRRVEKDVHSRQAASIVHGGGLSERRRHKLCQLHDCSCDTLQPCLEIPCNEQVADVQEIIEGLAESLPNSQSTPDSVGGDSTARSGLFQPAEVPSCGEHVADVCALPPAFGGSATATQGHCATGEGWTCGIPFVDGGAASVGVGEAVKNEGVRRKPNARSGLPRRDWSISQAFLPSPAASSGDLEPLQRRPAELSSGGPGEAGVAGSGGNASLQISSRGCIPRLCNPQTGHSGHSAAGAMVVSGQCSALSKRGKAHSNFRGTGRTPAAGVHSGRAVFDKAACQPARSIPASLHEQVFLEVFSGSGHLGAAVSKQENYPVLLWDVLPGPDYDLRAPQNRHKILGWARCRRVVGGNLGTPCHAFTRARDHPPGPPPLRSNQHVLGLPNLKPGDQMKVTEGNLLMRFSVQLLTLCLLFQIPFTMENPATSRLWLCPQVQQLMRRKNVKCWTGTVEFCMFNTPWPSSARNGWAAIARA